MEAKDKPLLNDPEVFPTEAILSGVLKASHKAYQSLVNALDDLNITIEWRYYQDSKSWLGKCQSKKKTVFWLSVWDGYFRISLFFTEKTRSGIQSLQISEDIKRRIADAPIRGRLAALILNINEQADLDDALEVIRYKQQLK